MFGIKQGDNGPLKEYLEHFDKAVVQIKSCSDDTSIQAFREGVKDRRLVWMLTYDMPPTFAHLRGIAWKHAEADKYIKRRGLAAREQLRLPEKKSDKNVARSSQLEKGKAISLDGKAEAPPGPRTLVGRFANTPLW